MGLAASQARLLFITMRQNDVSAKMQRISNENLILARDAEDLDAKYKQMKNVETYQVGGVDLSYDLLMGSQAAQNGTLTLLQSKGGAVVLSPSMANNLGLSNPGSSEAFKTKWPDQTKFIAKMTGMDEANVKTILNEINGSSSSSSSSSSDSENKLSINGFLASLSGGTTSAKWAMDDDNYGWGLAAAFGTGENDAQTAMNRLCQNSAYINQIIPSASAGGGIEGVFGRQVNSWGRNGTGTNETSVHTGRQGYSLQDLYNNAGKFTSTMMLASIVVSHDWNDAPKSWDNAVSAFQAFADLVSNSLVASASNFMNKTATDVIRQKTNALCKEWTNNKLWDEAFYDRRAAESGYDWNDQGFKHNEDALGAALLACQGQAGIVAASDDGDGYVFACDAGKFVKDLINSIMNTFTGGACCDKYANNESSRYDTTTSFTILSKYTTKDAETETPKTPDEIGKANVSFYKNMYNTMAVYGYLVDDKVNTSSYLNEKLQNNQYYVNGTSVENSKTVTKKVDENAQEEAKEFYDMEMAKIKRKEKQLDNDMTKLQTEYSALTNDYNSVKGLVDANIQRSFTYCSQG